MTGVAFFAGAGGGGGIIATVRGESVGSARRARLDAQDGEPGAIFGAFARAVDR